MPTTSRIELHVDADVDLSQRRTIADALDILGVALASHHHQWTPQERESYDAAVKAVADVRLSEGTMRIDDHGDHYRITPFHRGDREILEHYANSSEHVALKGTGAGSARSTRPLESTPASNHPASA